MQLTTRDAARLLGVSDSTLHRWLKSGELPATRVNDSYRLNRIDLLEFAAARNLPISADLLAELETEAHALPSLADAVRAGGVHRGISGTDKSSMLRDVVERLPLPRPPDRDLLHRVLLAREALGSTGSATGSPSPTPGTPSFCASPAGNDAAATSTTVEFGAIDGKPVHTLVTIVTPSTRVHLHLLALVAAALHDVSVRSKLEARAGAEELLPEVARVEAAIAAQRGGGRR